MFLCISLLKLCGKWSFQKSLELVPRPMGNLETCQNDPSIISGPDQKFNVILPITFDCSDRSLLPLR